jgi:uncharacterized protein
VQKIHAMTESNNSVTFSIKVVPRAKRDEIVGIENDVLKIRLTAPPVEGRANEALIKFLAQKLSLARANIEIVRGETSRTKVMRVRGISAEEVRKRLS